MAKVNKVITLHFSDRRQLNLLTREQVGNVVMALFEHFEDGKPQPELQTDVEKLVYLSIESSMQRQIDRYCGPDGQASKMKGNQNARKTKEDEPQITVE